VCSRSDQLSSRGRKRYHKVLTSCGRRRDVASDRLILEWLSDQYELDDI
jgi:hypothetical protein